MRFRLGPAIPLLLACGLVLPGKELPRITDPIDESQRVQLPQKPHHLARPEFDRGSAPASLPMNRMMLVLKRSPERAAQLKTLLDAQTRASSPQFHRWITPAQFGEQFGAADEDVSAITAWLRSHGFSVQTVAKGGGTIEFSGNAQQVSDAFHTSVHRFVVNGEEHWSNTASPSIPAALAPVISGIATLNSFHPRARGKVKSRPFFTAPNGTHSLAPADFATIYNINPLYKATPAIDGAGATIAVVGASTVDPADVSAFRSQFGLAPNLPQILYPYGQPDQSIQDPEATLDVSWSGAVAPGAAINYVAIPDTFADDGLLLSEMYIVENNLGDIVTESFGICEGLDDSTLNALVESTREQAAAQGMTYIVSAGDNGPYACDDFDSEIIVEDPTLVSVNLLAASPYVTAVGGTMFNDTANPSQFWGPPAALPAGTALSYIPENVWEESCDSQFCFMNILAGSGGPSSVYPKPSWQSGVTGIQQDGTRDLPDVSLVSATVDPYLICFAGSCGNGFLAEVSGTSAAAPSFAGIMALVRQKTGVRLGAINPQLYALAASEDYSNCNGSLNTVASSCVFNDITLGSNGVNGEPNFGTSTALYQAGVGYDMATGLGSVNAANLVNNWAASGEQPTNTSLTITPATLIHGAAATITIAVTSANNSGIPTGPVGLNSPTIGISSLLLASGTAQSTTTPLPGGIYTVSALYGGDGTYAPSTSTPVPLTIAPEASIVSAEADAPCDFGPFCRIASAPYGSPVSISGRVVGASGIGAASGTLTFTDSAQTTGGSLTLNNDGSGVFGSSNFVVGRHLIQMTYSGDNSFLPASAPPISLTITKAPTTVTLTPSSFCGQPNMPFALTGQVNSDYSTVDDGTLTVLSANPQISAPVNGSSDLLIPSLPAGLNTIAVSYSGDSNYEPSSGTVVVNISSGTCLAAMVNGADYQAGVAPQEIVSIFGVDLADSVTNAASGALPQTLNGTSVTVTDSAGTTQPADLFFVSPGQINCAIPAGLAYGRSTVQIASPQGVSQFPVDIGFVSPALFSADGTGTGLAAADIVRDHQGTLTTEAVTSKPIAFNGDDLYLVLFGTGSAGVGASDLVGILLNGQLTFPSYIGPQGGFEGLDQINVPIPYSLAGAGSVTVQMNVDGIFSNTVTVPFQ